MASKIANKQSRAPSTKLAEERALKKKNVQNARNLAEQVEGNFRKSGGYGKTVVSVWAVPPGGIENSPAYVKLKLRCGGTLPPPHKRAGAPISGGFPLNKYPPNVLVDGQRCFWVPDDWAQVLKNTGPGGVYIGWMSPEGKFFYHRRGYPSAIDESLGQITNALTGFNGILRNLKAKKEPNVDKRLLEECLTSAERQHVLPADKFHFAVVSARRAKSDDGQYDVMVVEAQFRLAGVRPTWYVDADSLQDYRNLGLQAIVGGKLTPSRNMALDHAEEKGLICVQVSDDISKWVYYDVERQNLRGEKSFTKANNAVKGSRTYTVSPVAAAQLMHAKMAASPNKPRLAGVFPTGNPSMTIGVEEFSLYHFILGDFFVALPSPIRFDTTMTLKEDYDYSCTHISEHGSVLRCNRMLLAVKHSTNSGGAVSVRDASGAKERYNIAILQKKWPGVFTLNKKRQDEVLMYWHKGCEADEKEAKVSAKGRRRTWYADEDEEGRKRKTPDRSETTDVTPAKKRTPFSPKPLKAAGRSVAERRRLTASRKMALKGCAAEAGGFPLQARLVKTEKDTLKGYIRARCEKCHNQTVEQCLRIQHKGKDGKMVKYSLSDLRYDVKIVKALKLVTA